MLKYQPSRCLYEIRKADYDCPYFSLMLATVGCSKTYYLDFTKEEDFIRNDGTWSSYGNVVALSSECLFMGNNWVAVPHVYKGDLTATVRFDLDTNQDDSISYFEIYLSVRNGFSGSDGYAGINFTSVGLDSASYNIFHGNDAERVTYYLESQKPIRDVKSSAKEHVS